MARDTQFRYCSVKYMPGEPFDQSTPPKDRITAAIYINFPEAKSQEEYEESFQAKRAKRICSRVCDIPGVTEVSWEQDFVSIRLHDKASPQDILSKLGAILRQEEQSYHDSEREETKREIEKLVASVSQGNYESHLAKANALLDSRPSSRNSDGPSKPAPAAMRRAAEVEALVDRYVVKGGLQLKEVKSIFPNGLRGTRDLTYRFTTRDGFMVLISLIWSGGTDQEKSLEADLLADVLLTEMPDECLAEFGEFVLNTGREFAIPLRLTLMEGRTVAVTSRYHLLGVELDYQERIIRSLLPCATEVFSRLSAKFRVVPYRDHVIAMERKPC